MQATNNFYESLPLPLRQQRLERRQPVLFFLWPNKRNSTVFNSKRPKAVHTETSTGYVTQEGKVDSVQATGEKKGGSRNVLKCFYCNKLGHLKKDCRKRKKDELSDEQVNVLKGTKSSNNDNSVPSGVVMSVQGRGSILRGWIFDSGATDHFTNEFDDLEEPKKVFPKSWGVANGSSLESMYMGNVRFGACSPTHKSLLL